WDGDGSFGNNANEIYSDTLSVGSNTVSVAVPADAVAGATCARFRYSSAGGLGATGSAPDGEVEDYEVTVVAPEDWGDAPDPTYPTLEASNGPRHVILASNNPTLGSTVDAEDDGQPTSDHTGDDANGSPDDEDGVTLPAEFVGGSTVDITVTASGAGGTLDFFVDWDGDGSFGNNANEIYSDTLSVGSNTVSVVVPADAVAGTTCARFRYSSAGGLGATGSAPDGEVEDYEVTVVAPEDWGDAPDPTYPTLEASNGPRHVILASNNPTLGSTVDAEDDGQPTSDHTGDDANGSPDDEDGVTLPAEFVGGATVDITVTASGAGGTLDFFVDWDGDGSFGNNANEIYSDTLSVGSNTVSVAVPADAVAGATCARFRYSSAGGLDATGSAPDGEVEDYEVTVADPRDYGDAPDTYGTTSGASHVIVTGFSLGASNDSEPEGQPTPGADGDDGDGNDDEDGIVFAGGMAMAGACSSGNSLDVTLDNTAGLATALLDAWIDFDGNGVFDDPAEHLFGGNSAVLGPASGVTTLTYDVPCDAVPQATSYARFRLSSAGGTAPSDMAADGEVEDYAFQVKGVDYGDAPDSYGTTMAADGPSHTIVPGFSLGATEDSEADGQPNAGADGDDMAGTDDEDGVVLVGGMANACATDNALEVTLTNSAGVGSALLDAWADFDGNGIFDDPAEHLFGGISQPLTSGLNNLTYDVPCDAAPQATTYARFRLSSTGGLPPTDAGVSGPIGDGEVEDYLVEVKGVDYGDAPDSYGTTMAADGPSHTIIPGYSLGAAEDTESDGQPSVGADGDDSDADGDDEDGVMFAGGMAMAAACSTGNGLEVVLTDSAGVGAAFLDAWIDFDGNGVFDDPAEHLFGGTSVALAVGANALTYDVPCAAAAGDVYTRFRLSSVGGLPPTDAGGSGPADDGEVEDYAFQLKGLDFGDALETEGYPTLFASDGARHVILPADNPVLGMTVDSEADGQPSADHLGDDQAGSPDDEDGVVFSGALIPGTTATVEVTTGATGGNLNAWIDFDRDGMWSAGEQIAVDLPLAANTTTPVDVMVPVTAVEGASCGRFRISSQTGLSPTGLASDGEIEDHQIAIGEEDPAIGIAKEIIAVTEVSQSEFGVLFLMTVTNFGNVPISDVQVVADLADAFADAESFAVDAVISADFTVNGGFDGSGDINLLAGTDTLAVGATGFIELEVLIVPGTNPGPYFCSSTVTGTSPNDVEVSDVSQEGSDPDPDGSGDPTDDEEPTVVQFDLPVIDIPTLAPAGMTLLVLLLSFLGLSTLRRRR
ncbi:MAG: GEVED domain-containing protein, partial [Acidobacteriota bacterium]